VISSPPSAVTFLDSFGNKYVLVGEFPALYHMRRAISEDLAQDSEVLGMWALCSFRSSILRKRGHQR